MQEAHSVEEQAHKLREAEDALPQAMQDLEMARRMVHEQAAALDDLHLTAEAKTAGVRELPGLEDELARHTAAEEGLQRSYRTQLQQQGDVEGELRRLETMETNLRGRTRGLAGGPRGPGAIPRVGSSFRQAGSAGHAD